MTSDKGASLITSPLDRPVTDLPPGDYLAIALDDVDENEWANADYLDRFRARATPVTIGEGPAQTVTLPFAGTP